MEIERSFDVAEAPDRVYAFLLDINRVVGCMPGAELTEVVDPNTYSGKVKIKVGPITVAYNGTARITERDVEARTAKLEASGRETTGPGGAEATALMTVTEAGSGSMVTIKTDYTVRGRVANFGRGVMEDVSRRLMGQMGDCIKATLEGAAATQSTAPAPAATASTSAPVGQSPAPGETAPELSAASAAAIAQAGRPVNAISLFFSVLWARIRRLFRRA